jgi:hypothetical protein
MNFLPLVTKGRKFILYRNFIGLLWLEHRKTPSQMKRRNQSDSNPLYRACIAYIAR